MSQRTPLYDVAERAGANFVIEAGWELPGDHGNWRAEYEQAGKGAVLFDVSNRSKIQIKGKDAQNYLHNFCTNDIKSLKAGCSCETFLCTAKAKAVAYALIDHETRPAGTDLSWGGFWLDADPGLAEKIIRHLDHFIIGEQVDMTDRTADLAQMRLVGPHSRPILGEVAGVTAATLGPHREMAARMNGIDVRVRRHDLPFAPSFDILCAATDAEAIWLALTAKGARPSGLAVHEVLRIEAAVPVWGKDIDNERFVVEVGRIEQAICYTKGCYLGQEPIVMARDRGHVNRRLVTVRIDGPKKAPRGSRLLRDGAEVGQVTSSVPSPRLGSALALAYLKRGHWEPGTTLELETEDARRAGEVVAPPLGGSGGLSP